MMSLIDYSSVIISRILLLNPEAKQCKLMSLLILPVVNFLIS